jgi:putative Ca2+/H+ antiporter (TMEM165/GDT1 family)
MTIVALFAMAYAAVLSAELLGDKTAFALGTLAARYGAARVLLGAIPALAFKMGVGVWFGRAIAGLPGLFLVAISVATFAMMAVSFGLRTSPSPAEKPSARGWHPALIAGGGLLLSEWADPGQITAGLLAAQTHRPGLVWLAATSALITKALAAVQVGHRLRRWVSTRTMRTTGMMIYGVMAVLTALGVWR